MEENTLKSFNPFYLDDTPTMPGKKVLRVNHEMFHCKSTVGSYQLLGARLFGISFANYLRLCRDEFGAEIYGKGDAYPVPYFNDDLRAHNLVKMLNKLAGIVEWERTHPEVMEWAAAKETNQLHVPRIY